MNSQTIKNNGRMLDILSFVLNEESDTFSVNEIKKISKYNITEEEAIRKIFCLRYLKTDDNDLYEMYFTYMFTKLDSKEYINNSYNKMFSPINIKENKWEIKKSFYKPYQLFVYDDFEYLSDGRIIPKIGFFDKPFYYTAVYENKRLWMSITPNEIETMKEPINEAEGNVLVLGLGLGYYSYMISLKENVDTITIIEKDKNIISLFSKNILPNFEYKDKIKIIEDDAFIYLERDLNIDNINYVFSDIWHDVSDGKDMYLKIKKQENKYPNIKFRYWIEKTIKYYL